MFRTRALPPPAAPHDIIWLDDDCQAGTTDVNGLRVLCVNSCQDAANALEASRDTPPAWVVVDLVVPQAGWPGETLLNSPGIEFIGFVSNKYREVRACAFSSFLTDDRRRMAERAGAKLAIDKKVLGFSDLLERLRQPSAPEGPPPGMRPEDIVRTP